MPRPPISAVPAVLAVMTAPALVASAAPEDAGQVTVMTFHERVIMRVPRVAPPPVPVPAWKEKHGPRCVAAADLAGALVAQPGVVDLVLAGNHRVRARLDKACAPLDYYAGFYIKPAADQKICAGRDSIRTRSGAACQIDEFRSLKPIAPQR